MSQREWQIHDSIVDIRNTHSDPEAVFIDAKPQDVIVYLRVKRRIAGLQAELDSCWAVLGEVYGRFGELADLGLVIRRARTNLDDERAFSSTVEYIPREAKFNSAGADLLKLLITPLYGDKPEVGIRELMQNALDACTERENYVQNNPAGAGVELADQDADVVIVLERTNDGRRYLTVSDRGIGMTVGVVSEYFLKAGASFRRSDAWRREHEGDTGKSRILRSGRFGVGALAAFLIGDEIEVSTRHIGVPHSGGICFSATLESEAIQLNHCSRAVGTTVRVLISREAVWDALANVVHWEDRDKKPAPLRQWDYYCASVLKVKRSVIKAGKQTILPQRLDFPSPRSEVAPPWHRIDVPEYADVHWAYQRESRLVCNGILVSEQSYPYEGRDWFTGFYVSRPTVSVWDPDAHLPLNLQRTGLSDRDLPFRSVLYESQCEDLIAWALAVAPAAPLVTPGDSHPSHPRIAHKRPRLMFAFTAKGSVFIEPFTFSRLSPSRVIFFPVAVGNAFAPARGDLLVPLDTRLAGIDDRRAWLRSSLGWNLRGSFQALDVLHPAGRRTIIGTSFYNDCRKPGIVAQNFWESVSVGPANRRWTVLSTGTCEGGKIDFEALLQSKEDVGGLTEYYHVRSSPPPPFQGWGTPWPLEPTWKKLSEEVLIPYDRKRRESFHRLAFERLRAIIDYYAETATKGQSKARTG